MVFEEFDLCFPFESRAVIRNFFDVHQFRRTVHAGVARASPRIVLFEPAKRVGGPAGVVTTVGTQEHIAIVCHESLSAADQEVHDRHQWTADDDAKEIKTKPRSDENQS